MTFKEWCKQHQNEDTRIGDIASDILRDENFPDSSDYKVLYSYIKWDDDFPLNSDSSWKSYRMLLKYIMKKWHYRFWDDFKKLYYEYQNILEGRWFP